MRQGGAPLLLCLAGLWRGERANCAAHKRRRGAKAPCPRARSPAQPRAAPCARLLLTRARARARPPACPPTSRSSATRACPPTARRACPTTWPCCAATPSWPACCTPCAPWRASLATTCRCGARRSRPTSFSRSWRHSAQSTPQQQRTWSIATNERTPALFRLHRHVMPCVPRPPAIATTTCAAGREPGRAQALHPGGARAAAPHAGHGRRGRLQDQHAARPGGRRLAAHFAQRQRRPPHRRPHRQHGARRRQAAASAAVAVARRRRALAHGGRGAAARRQQPHDGAPRRRQHVRAATDARGGAQLAPRRGD